jgi:hypothetical protein
MPSMGKALGVMMRLLKKGLQVQNTNWYKKGIDAPASRRHKAVEVDGD